jgi:hypothetical protein
MKLPNGYGSVTKLQGNRRKPYLARVTLGWTVDKSSEKSIQKRVTIGTYKTKKEALQALSEYGTKPYDIENSSMTLAELYDKWSKHYFPSLTAPSSIRNMTSSWKYCHTMYNMKIRDIRTRHIKNIIDYGYIISSHGDGKEEKKSPSIHTKTRIKVLFSLMLDYALEYEWIDRNYARSFKLSKDIRTESKVTKTKHIIFDAKELQCLWDNVSKVNFADWILIQCYMGWRPQEFAELKLKDVNLEKKYIIGGMKTIAGKNRIVPIHSKIYTLVKENYDNAVKLGSDKLLNDASLGNAMQMNYNKYSWRFNKVISHLELNKSHRPHDPRKTFVTMAKRAGVDEFSIKKIIGHTSGDITETIYTERNLEWLQEELEKIP